MRTIILCLFFLFQLSCFAKNDSTGFFSPSGQFNSKRFTGVVASEGLLCSATLIGLNSLWYKDYPRSNFHFFNDNDEWLQMDKVGHAVTAHYIGKVGIDAMKWSGVKAKKAIWYGGSLGLVYLTAVEVLDGFSSEWGASVGDLAASILGIAIVISEELVWDEQRILLKYSFHRSDIAQYRPQLLGNSYTNSMLKDYNGQTYWISFNIASFLKGQTDAVRQLADVSVSRRFPKWLNIAFGYGAHGMTGGSENPTEVDGEPIQSFDRYRQYYLSLDIDLTRIKTRSGLLKACFKTLSFIKIPFPALEYNTKDGFVFCDFYF
ncbi:MAG: DUF2279 domain-containing protein [Bacteroidota bacterium]